MLKSMPSVTQSFNILPHPSFAGYAAAAMELWLIPFRHNEWATRVLLDRCRALDHEQFHRRFEIGLGNLHDTFRHIVGAMARWSDRIAECTVRPSIEKEPRLLSIDELMSMLEVAARDLEEVARSVMRDERASEMIEAPVGPDGSSVRFARSTALVHITTHGMHHRAQALNMMRHLGVQPLPELDPIDWELSITGQP